MVTEVLCHRQTGQRHSHSGPWRLVHLSENHGGLVQNAGLRHFTVQVVSFTRTLADSGKYGNSVSLCRDIVNQLLNQNGFSYTGSAEQPDFSASCVRSDQIDDLDSGLKNLRGSVLIFKSRSLSVNRPFIIGFHLSLAVDRIAEDVEQTAENIFADRNRNRSACIDCLHASGEAVRGRQSDTANLIVSLMLRNFRNDFFAILVLNFNGVHQFRKLIRIKFYIYNWSDNLMNLTLVQ